MPAVAEFTGYGALYFTYTFFVIRLTCLGLALGFPLQDDSLARADAALGFDWLSWARFFEKSPLVSQTLSLAYLSIRLQPILMVAALAVLRPRTGNAELFMSLICSMALTLLISTFVPAIGPAEALGLHPSLAELIRTIHEAPTSRVLEYQGIVTFPSFHSAIAVLLVYAARANRVLFGTAAALNALMLVSTPFFGDHYLVDVLAGMVVALTSLVASTWIISPKQRFRGLANRWGMRSRLRSATARHGWPRKPASQPSGL